ncbi:hypothetical protein SAMN05216364_1002173 [Porphyromonadaceae bacterium KHP3R9]|jgi:hypothetical protein|nr:hypothetical protein SAMN05216364_1002173 [Porphyromonadaceae bacterium KHP3R9]
MSIPQIKERLPYLVNAFSFLSPKPINIGVRMVNGHSQPAGRK